MRKQKPFLLYSRPSGIIYARFFDERGATLTSRSTHTTCKAEAEKIAWNWAFNGIPVQDPSTSNGLKRTCPEKISSVTHLVQTIAAMNLDANDAMRIVKALMQKGLVDIPVIDKNQGQQGFIAYLRQFWDYDHSPYVKDRLSHNHRIGRRHCYESYNRIKMYWEKEFADRAIGSIGRHDLKGFALRLHEAGNLSPKTINAIMDVGIRPLAWAFREGMIATNPTEHFERFATTPRKKGILTVAEAKELLSRKWQDKYAYAGNLLAITTGMRAGEILAIQRKDIGDEPVAGSKYYQLFVRHSWSSKGEKAVKCPKNGEARIVPLLPEVRSCLLDLLRENPHTTIPESERFVFWSRYDDRPHCHERFLRVGLQKECEKLGIDWKGRNIVFHSHRHFYAARMADKADAEKIRRITGHKDLGMFEHYANHVSEQNIADMAGVIDQVLKA